MISDKEKKRLTNQLLNIKYHMLGSFIKKSLKRMQKFMIHCQVVNLRLIKLNSLQHISRRILRHKLIKTEENNSNKLFRNRLKPKSWNKKSTLKQLSWQNKKELSISTLLEKFLSFEKVNLNKIKVVKQYVLYIRTIYLIQLIMQLIGQRKLGLTF